MKILFTCLLIFISVSIQSANAQGLREKIRERIKERLVKNQEEKPAPKTEIDAEAQIVRPGNYSLSFTHKGIMRMYQLHVPVKYNALTPSPLLVALHGGGGEMSYQSNDKYYKQISKSEELGFIVAFPNGYSKFNSGKFATWNAGKCCGDARDKNIDDVGFIKELVGRLTAQLNIDKNKVYATGMSNGAMMSYRLACELSDIFKGIAAVAGTDNTIDCTPKNPISILHIHALDDDHVLFNGGAGKGTRDKSKVTDFNSVPNSILKWVKSNGCNETPKRILEKKGAYCDVYLSCKKSTMVQLCVTETGAHSWPGGEKVRGSQSSSKAISANDITWDFFNQLR